jgi:hypothetical protein
MMMNKKTSLVLIILLVLSTGFSSTSACSLSTNSYTWHCSNNSPGINISPGEKGEVVFYCCYTGPGLTGDEELGMDVQIKTNDPQIVQQENGSWININEFYPGSEFITGITYNSTIHPNEDTEIIIHFSLPEESEYYEAGEVIEARTDVLLDDGGSFILNNVIETRIFIPYDWNPSLLIRVRNFIRDNYLWIGIGILILIVLFIIIQRK